MTLPAATHSIYGRLVGLDKDGRLMAANGLRSPRFQLEPTTLTTGSTVSNSGVGLVDASTAAKSFTLEAPVGGAVKHLFHNTTSTSTAAIVFTLVSGNFQTTASSTYTTLTFNGAGQYAHLVAQSTSRFQVTNISAAAVLA